jgi:AcrR family transcriptional regulator
MIAEPVEILPANRVGRPRSEGCRQKVLAAADTLFMRDGLTRMSVDAVAQLAGVSKATIYRWWPNKSAIVMEALLNSSEAEVYVPISPHGYRQIRAEVPHTFYVLAILMLFLGGSAILVTPKDIFPRSTSRWSAVIWQYTGLTPEEMEQRVTTYSEYSISATSTISRTSKARPCPGIVERRSISSPTSIWIWRSRRSSPRPTRSAR